MERISSATLRPVQLRVGDLLMQGLKVGEVAQELGTHVQGPRCRAHAADGIDVSPGDFPFEDVSRQGGILDGVLPGGETDTSLLTLNRNNIAEMRGQNRLQGFDDAFGQFIIKMRPLDVAHVNLQPVEANDPIHVNVAAEQGVEGVGKSPGTRSRTSSPFSRA